MKVLWRRILIQKVVFSGILNLFSSFLNASCSFGAKSYLWVRWDSATEYVSKRFNAEPIAE